MKIFYLIIFIGCSFFAGAQSGKPATESPSPATLLDVRSVKFYPNPAISVINFEFEKPVSKDITLQIFNFIGKKVFEINSVAQKNVIPLNDFFRGVYIYQVRDKSGKILESGKFQIAK